MRKKIYLDYASTTPLDKDVLRAMLPYMKGEYGNPSSSHVFGQRAMAGVDNARSIVAGFLGCELEEVVFTGSATEADNMAIRGVADKEKPHVITSVIEHEAVLAPCQELEAQGLATVTYIGVDEDGIVNVKDVENAIKKNTVLVSIMYANSEIGTVQPIAEIGRMLKKVNTKRTRKILFHTDAVQAVNYLDCNVDLLSVDLLTLSSHKIYGPKGVGALYIRSGAEIDPLVIGGGQEKGMRSGTENVAGIVGFGAALLKVQDPKIKLHRIKIRQMRDALIKSILKLIPEVQVNGSLKNRLANNVNVSFKDVEGFEVVVALDQRGIAVSTGSACSERRHEPSHVLLALGRSGKDAMSSLRMTLGRGTDRQDIEHVMRILTKTVERLRKKRV
ncbi:MAG: cysteine desulfurase [Patescibacteria group bacterium]|nr:cysteine desulfurase [Patescibacteria group bacterium]